MSKDARLSRLLAVYGVVVALLGGTLLWFLSPDPWPLQGTRATDLTAAVEAADAGEPPLVGLRPGSHGGTERYAVGTTDDQGIYLYAPRASNAFGLDAPDGVKLVWVFLFGLAIAAAPWLYGRLFDSTAAALVAPFGVILAVLALGFDYIDIYWIPAWAALALLPPLILVDRSRPRAWFVWVVLLVVGASFASSIRSNAGLAVALAALIVLLRLEPAWWRRGLGALAIVLAYLSISNLALSLVRDYRDNQVGVELGRGEPTGHSFWHPAYLGLGYLPNDEGIRFRDDLAVKAAQQEDPGVSYLSPGYNAALRDRTLDFIGRQPLFVIGELAQKLVVVVKNGTGFTIGAALLLPAFLLLGDGRAERRRMALLVVPALVVDLLPPLLAVPTEPDSYALGLFGGLSLLILLCISWASRVAEADIRRVPRRLVGALTGTRAGRRTLALSVGGVALVVVCVALAGPIEKRAVDWLNGAPPPPATSPTSGPPL